jgi:HEPN domain-containing protein
VSSPSPDQRDYAALLIAKATADRHAAHVLAEANVADELIGFHAQQSVEKAVKAVLVLVGARLPRIHDIERLLPSHRSQARRRRRRLLKLAG